MGKMTHPAAVVFALTALATASAQDGQPNPENQSFRFRSGVELINVTATVTDEEGRFVPGLRQEDFRVYEDGRPRPITHFTSERVPVSLGIVLDTSGSMDGEKLLAAKEALKRLLFDLLGPEDEIFLYRFDNRPQRLHGWTTDRGRLWRELDRVQARGATTLYDAIAEAVPMVATGQHRKKSLLIISDGNDSSSYTRISELKTMIHESEVLVYAMGIDAFTYRTSQPSRIPWFISILKPNLTSALFQRRPIPQPFPFPIPRRPTPTDPNGPRGPRRPRGPVLDPRGPIPTPRYPPPSGTSGRAGDEPVNVGVLREITEHSGGRTEIIRQPRDLGRATASIADELSQQYFLGYPAEGARDGRWHSIRVELVDRPDCTVRARKGYVATP